MSASFQVTHHGFESPIANATPIRRVVQPDIKAMQQKAAQVSAEIGSPVDLGTLHMPLSPDDRGFRVHTAVGTTITARFRRNPAKNNIEGQVFIEHWNDRFVCESIDLPNRPPDAMAVFSIHAKSLSENWRRRILADLLCNLNEGRGDKPTVHVPHPGHNGLAILKGTSHSPGLLDMDPNPLILINAHGMDPLYLCIRETVHSAQAQLSKQVDIDFTDGWIADGAQNGLSDRGEEALAVFNGARSIVLKKHGALEGQFNEFTYLRDKRGSYVNLYTPLQSVDQKSSFANELVQDLPNLTQIGVDIGRPHDSAETLFRNLTRAVGSFVEDHSTACPGDQLFATSDAVRTLVAVSGIPHLREHHYNPHPRSELRIVNAKLKGVDWPSLNLTSGKLVNCEMDRSQIFCFGDDSTWANCHVRHSKVGILGLNGQADEDFAVPAQRVRIAFGSWDSSVELFGAIGSGELKVKGFKPRMSRMHQFALTNQSSSWF